MSKTATATQPAHANVAIVNNDDLRKMRGDIEKTKGATATREAAVISQSEIARMKASTKIQSANEAAEQKRIAEEQKAQR